MHKSADQMCPGRTCSTPEVAFVQEPTWPSGGQATVGMLKEKGQKFKASLLSKLPHKKKDSAGASTSRSSEKASRSPVDAQKPEDVQNSLPSEASAEESPIPPALQTAMSCTQDEDESASAQKGAHAKIDPALAAAVLIFAVLALWRPALWMFLISIAGNVVLAIALVVQASYAQRQRNMLSKYFERSSETSESIELEADVSSTCGLQQLLEPGWKHMREVIREREHTGILTQIELGDKSPQVTSVRSVKSPHEGVVCFDVGLQLASSKCPFVRLEVPIPGYSDPWIFQMQLLQLDVTVQLYFWSAPPEGRGSGRSYSLIEAALSPEPEKPPMVSVALKAVSKSKVLEQVLCKCEHVASAVICSHVLPRFTGFDHRVILEEGRARKTSESTAWQQSARRAGWQPRAEAVVESAVSLARIAWHSIAR